ncbi:MAG: pseudouridine synthase [Ghiorsea sp.]
MNGLTYFPSEPAANDTPNVMPSPFSDIPHPLAKQACELLQQRLTEHSFSNTYDFFTPDSGKMFGVLIVQDKQGKIGFLSAFSGMMRGEWLIEGFVAPAFDLAAQNIFLPEGKAELTKMSEQLNVLEGSKQRAELKNKLSIVQEQRTDALAKLRAIHKAAKADRKQQRIILQTLTNPDEQHTQMRVLALASQHHKREAANVKQAWDDKIQVIQQPLDVIESQIEHIKISRANKSRGLHQQVFDGYKLQNFLGDQQTLTEFFPDATPPAGAGDCAGPKLIYHAQKYQLKPLVIAEFWWGSSPAAGVRHHKQFYPACRGKCRPILPFMLAGLDVEPEPYFGNNIDESLPEVIYDDDALLVINKPAGLMSEPGKEIKDSVFNRLLKRYPECPELRLVHRLDMSTSGLLLVAKNLKINKQLQKQFIQRTVEKRYEAVLSKVLPTTQNEGEVDLPLRVDFYDRPRQLACYEYGKPAKTYWKVLSRDKETTRVYFYPHTGRTHQLRVHASHRDGLNAAIVGDELYGLAGDRLLLHAQYLSFEHPISRKRLEFEIQAPF